MTSYFQNGRLIHIQDNNTPPPHLLGNMLLSAGVITKIQQQDILERQKLTPRQSFGYLLINAGHATREKLRGPLKSQMEATLQKMFSWKTGSYVFNSCNVNTFKSERITFGENHSDLINTLGKQEGSRLLEAEILSSIASSKNDNLFIMTSGTLPTENRGPINILLLAKFLDILKRRFDVILIDSLPLDAANGSRTLSSLVDGLIFVVKAGYLPVKVLNEAINCVSDDKVLGAILNQVKTPPNYYYR
jgi:hypothetical protein